MNEAFDRMIAAYRALGKLLSDGKVRAIGVSNFMPEHLERLLAETSIVPLFKLNCPRSVSAIASIIFRALRILWSVRHDRDLPGILPGHDRDG
jgi:aryl-alcohol dehydrogenase-like predicted oxidoreductase